MSDQGFTEWEILETHEDGWLAGDREQELQKEYGLPVDKVHYMISRQNRRKGGIVGGATRGTQVKGENNPRYGITLSQETKSKISESLKGSEAWNKGIPRSNETKSKISETLTGMTFSEERKKAIGDAQRGKQKPKSKCPRCGKMIANNMFERHVASNKIHK